MRRKKKSFRTGRTRILSIVLCLILVLGVLLPESGVLASGIQSAAVESTYESGGETSDSTTPETTVQESETSQSLSSESPADTSETIAQTEPSTSADETQNSDNETIVPDTGDSAGESQSGETEVAESAESVESETEQTQESELSYEQAARAALALYGTGAAFREGEVISDAQNYFEVSGVENQPPSFTVQVGEITADSVPKIEGYDFINATIRDNDGGQIVVNSVGTLTYGESTYIYYTTEGSSSSLAAMVLGSDQKITLNYELHRETYEITYSVTGDSSSVTVDSIFGTDRPTTVTSGNSYAFRVTIPRGYTATVSVNGAEKGQLGVEPTYTVDDPTAGVGSVITGSGELTLSGTYEITNVSENQTVTVKLTQRQNYDFSSYLWTRTRYAYGRASFETTSRSFNGVSSTQSRELWSFTTEEFGGSSGNSEWILDSLQINGTKLNIPYVSRNNRTDSETTVLPSGTVVTISAEYNSSRWSNRHSRTYTISVSNCYENITITGGNLNSSGWTEVIPDRLTGVEFQIFDRQSGDTQDQWKTLEQSEPFGVGNYGDNNKNYWFGTDGSLRFRLVSGYVNPKVTYGTTSGNDLSSLVSVSTTPDSAGWYYITISGQNSNSITMLRIEAEIGYYDVSYRVGDTNINVGDTLPSYDNGDYNIVNNDQIIVSSTIPVDSSNQYVFDYWTLEGYLDESGESIPIYPNQLLDLENVAGYAVYENGSYVLPLEAHWISSESAEQITYMVQFILVDENGDKTVVDTIAYQAPKGSTIILNTDAQEVKAFLERNPDYVLDEEKTERYFSDVQAGDVLPVYFTKAVTDVTITKDVTGGLGDVTKSFNFDLEIDGESQEGFSLTDGASEVLKNIKIGSTITFAETNAKGYIVTVTYTDSDSEDAKTVASNDGSYTVTVTKGMTITVENNKEAIPDTGVILDSLPYILIIAVIVVIAAVLIIRRHKLNQAD